MFDPYGSSLNGPVMWSRPQHGPQEHPHASMVLILGVLGVFCCGACAPVAWVLGARSLREIDAAGGIYGGRHQVMIGLVLGIIGTVFMVCGGVLFLLLVIGGHG
ncbi:MAG: hypothetical protein JWN03_7586 [Nocardia sp.]|uniref:DUF4190 domain-containing protein n=1 Tax=Nocardia sp. TaxID=1821 RepID=UPI002638F00C|nr:DUF4190 domain-containing protein [Nocardia sp.]MCU1647311.1 hypothetical protein [Nocardia sp.]